MEIELKNYLAFWKQKDYIMSNKEIKNSLYKIEQDQEYKSLIPGAFLFLFSVLFFGIIENNPYQLLELTLFILLWSIWAIFTYTKLKEKRKILLKKENLYSQIQKEFFNDNTIQSIFPFLIKYTECNMQPESITLKELIIKISKKEISKEDIEEFISINQRIQNKINIKFKEENLTKEVNSFFKKKQINLDSNNQNYTKENVKQKYLEML